MEKCRLCLKNRKRFYSLHTAKDGTKYSDMVHAITNVKILDNDANDKSCLSCCHKLEEAYTFKMMIESSNAELCNISNSKKITFSTIEDIKLKIEIPEYDKQILNNEINEKLKDGNEEFLYNEIVVTRKQSEKSAIEERERKYLMESLHSLKELDDACDDNEVDVEYDPCEDSDDDYLPQTMKVKQKKSSLKTNNINKKTPTLKINRINNANKENNNTISMDKPIKPKVLRDIRLCKTTPERKKCKRLKTRTLCPYCGKLWADIKTHILVHSGEKIFKCDVCQKGFFSLTSLTYHRQRHLPKTLRCDECIATFNTKRDLSEHKKSHSAIKPYVCEICSKAFRKLQHQVRHKALVHNIGAKQYKCEECEKIFKTPATLKHHIRVHTGERPYKCEICSQPYSYKHDFNRHCLKKHGVLFKRRTVFVMNEEVLMKEQALMRDLMFRINSLNKEEVLFNPFEGPQAAMAYQLITKALADRKIPLAFKF